MYFCTFQDSNKLLLLGKLISLSVSGLLGPDTVQPLERACLDKKRQIKSCLTIDIIEHYLTDGLEGLEGLHIGSDGHGTGPLGHSLWCHHLENKGQNGRSDVNHSELYLGASKLHSLGHLLGGGVTLPWLLGVDGEQDHLRLELLQSLRVQLKRLHTLVPGH